MLDEIIKMVSKHVSNGIDVLMGIWTTIKKTNRTWTTMKKGRCTRYKGTTLKIRIPDQYFIDSFKYSKGKRLLIYMNAVREEGIFQLSDVIYDGKI